MRDIKKIIFGAVLLAAGVILALNAFELTDIDIFFKGWWTLFIIIPSLVGVFTERDKSASLFGLLIGVLFLLSELEIIDFSLVWKIAVPAVIVIIAIKMIVNGAKKKDRREEDFNIVTPENAPSTYAIFGGKDLSFDGQPFEGTEIVAVFGGIDCDLRGAIIEKDCKITVVSVFGGADIIVPKNVRVVVDSTSVFGGCDDETVSPENPVATLYIDVTSVFGGTDVKNG